LAGRAEEIAIELGVRLRSFDDTPDALEWLNCRADQTLREYGAEAITYEMWRTKRDG
jgi:hypothetical protein